MNVARKCHIALILAGCIGIISPSSFGAEISIYFDRPLQEWDGFGVNYVETSQTRDYDKWPQDYGGFSTLSETQKQEIVQLIFDEDGLKPGLVKMFVDSFHEGATKADNDNADPLSIHLDGYTHARTTGNMRYFVREGLKLTRVGGRDLTVIITLYGPAPWMTRQKTIRGRDLDPAEKLEAGEYLAAFAKYMRDREGFPVKYISLHNEGEHPIRYNPDGRDGENLSKHDYNLLWTPGQVADFIGFLREILDANGMQDVGIAPGECTNWMFMRPIAQKIADTPSAIGNLGLITSHGFLGAADPSSDWYAPLAQDNFASTLLKSLRPDLHVWTTSASWGKMDVNFLELIRGHIYENHHNGFIPWAAVQRHNQWVGGDPNPGCAIKVSDEGGSYSIRPGYYLYKQICRAGQPGMRVASVSSNDNMVWAIAFAKDDTANPDAFTIVNRSWFTNTARILVSGTPAKRFAVYRTIVDTFPKNFWPESKPAIEEYAKLPDAEAINGIVEYKAPPLSVTTFYAK